MAKNQSNNNKGDMTVSEAGHKGGETVKNRYGRGFYQEIGEMGGQKGGQRVKDLIEKGKEAEGQ